MHIQSKPGEQLEVRQGIFWRSLRPGIRTVLRFSVHNFSPAGWYGKIGEGTLADAILDRIVHDSYTILVNEKNLCANARELMIS
jgi:hypothetical protein